LCSFGIVSSEELTTCCCCYDYYWCYNHGLLLLLYLRRTRALCTEGMCVFCISQQLVRLLLALLLLPRVLLVLQSRLVVARSTRHMWRSAGRRIPKHMHKGGAEKHSHTAAHHHGQASCIALHGRVTHTNSATGLGKPLRTIRECMGKYVCMFCMSEPALLGTPSSGIVVLYE